MNHTFFAKTKRNRIIIPNKIIVSNYAGTITGSAVDQTSIDDYRLVAQTEQFYSIADNTQAGLLAAAILQHNKVHAEMSSAEVPMNLAQEVYDYVKITDTRETTTFVGNVGLLRRTYQQGKYQMFFVDGGWLSLRGLLGEIDADGSPSEKNIVANHILVGQIDFTDITQDKISDGVNYRRVKSLQINAAGLIFYDSIEDTGNTYQKVLGTQISAGKILLSSECTFAEGYNPTGKEPGITKSITAPPAPKVGDLWLDANYTPAYMKRWTGTAWAEAGGLYMTDIQEGHLNLTSNTKSSGKWYNKSGVMIDADSGITIYGPTNMALTTRATLTGAVQCYVGTNGAIYAGAGAVYLDATGITIKGVNMAFKTQNAAGVTQCYMGSDGAIYAGAGTVSLDADGVKISGEHLILKYTDGYVKGWIFGTATGLRISSTTGLPIEVAGRLETTSTYTNTLYDILPYNASTWLGSSTQKWQRVYYQTGGLVACPLPTHNSASDIIKKVKPPKIIDGVIGKRHYFEDADFPDEMTVDAEEKDKEGKIRKLGYRQIELTSTSGILVQTMREVLKRLDALEAK